MELSSSDKERIQHQYDALAKKTLVGEAKSHRRTLAKRAAREVTFSDLSESELAQLFTTDEYESDYFRFQVSGFDVLVKNELLAEALNGCASCVPLGITFAATPFPDFQAAGFSSSRPQSRLAIPRVFFLSVSSWVVTPFYLSA